MPENMVSVLKCDLYEAEHLRAVIRRHFDNLGGISKYVKQGTKVLLKVNLLMAKTPEKAVTTHPAFVKALAQEIIAAGGSVTIADSPGGPYTMALLNSVYRQSWMDKVAQAVGASLNTDLTADDISREENKICHSFHFIKPYFDCDLLISVAKLKTHTMAAYSGAVKNLFGLIPGLEKPEFHLRYPDKWMFGKMLIDLCETAKPALSFVDGIIAHEGNGPSGGTPLQVGLTFAAVNPHALDLVAADAIGLKPSDVITVAAAVERGLCPRSPKEVELVGESLEAIRVRGFKLADTRSSDFIKLMPASVKNAVSKIFSPRPQITRATCIGCGKCAESCPMKTIHVTENKAQIDYNKCIKCFCCQEMCPVKSIKIRRNAFFRI
jgi:uncharacterized protein (DUF362 family)/NAD-dependent dihydropyrimidine dehydrogenase PreA subunit